MQLVKSKKAISILLGALALFVMLFVFACLPSTVSAAAGTLGTESPEIYCTYTNSEGAEVDGNSLEAGTYNVSFMLKGMSNISVIQVTGAYGEGAEMVNLPNSLLSDTVADITSEGCVISDGNIVFGFVSNNDDTSVIKTGEEDVCLASFTVTFSDACDAADVITVSTNPNNTFALADYADGYNDEYALDTEYADYSGTLYPMTCDVTPVLSVGYSVSGSIVIMTNSSGATAGNAVSGEYTLDVYSDIDRTQLVTSVTTVESVDENNKKVNSFVIDSLETGTYYATLSGQYAISRNDITIIVATSDIIAPAIPIIACDYNVDKTVTGIDAVTVYSNASSAQADYCDLNGDGSVTGIDATIVYSCSASGNYDSITIQ